MLFQSAEGGVFNKLCWHKWLAIYSRLVKFLCKAPDIKYFRFVGHTILFCHYSSRTATDNMQMSSHDYVLIKLHSQTWVAGLWLIACQLLLWRKMKLAPLSLIEHKNKFWWSQDVNVKHKPRKALRRKIQMDYRWTRASILSQETQKP